MTDILKDIIAKAEIMTIEEYNELYEESKKERHEKKKKSLIERPKLHNKAKPHSPTFGESHDRFDKYHR